jgi:hypothetical protein
MSLSPPAEISRVEGEAARSLDTRPAEIDPLRPFPTAAAAGWNRVESRRSLLLRKSRFSHQHKVATNERKPV